MHIRKGELPGLLYGVVERQHLGVLESVELSHAESQDLGNGLSTLGFVQLLGASLLEAEHGGLLMGKKST